MSRPTIASLFAGIGGFDCGFDQAGFRTIWMCEKDKSCQNILRRHWLGVPIYDDVADLDGSNLARPDVITFGSPCQDLSVAGQRAGIQGARSSLFFAACRVIGELQPSFAVWENVPGAFSSNSGRDFAAVLDALVQCGARDIAWRVLDAQYFGLAQRRKRVFLVADFRGERASEVLAFSEGVQGYPPARRKAGQVTAPLSSSGAGSGRTGNERTEIDMIVQEVARSEATREGQHQDESLETLLVFNEAQITSRANRRTVRPGQESPTMDGCGRISVAYTIQSNDGGDHKRKDRPEGGLYVQETDTALTVGTTDLTAVVFAQNTRDEVREMPIVGALAAQPGTKQTSYIMQSLQPEGRSGVGSMQVRRLTPL